MHLETPKKSAQITQIMFKYLVSIFCIDFNILQ